MSLNKVNHTPSGRENVLSLTSFLETHGFSLHCCSMKKTRGFNSVTYTRIKKFILVTFSLGSIVISHPP